jgi:hypothetical protein
MGREKSKKSLIEKVREIDEHFAEEAYSLTDDQLKDKMVSLAKYDEELEVAKENDQDLQEKQEQAKVANETYSVPRKANKLKRKLVLEVLRERGKV